MSETLMLISNPYTGQRRAGTVGLPLPGVSVRAGGLDGPRRRPAGKPVKCWSVARTSSPATGATRRQPSAAFVDGWFRTGDIASRSADGYYTLCGRASDLIISSGFNVYPREIEELLLELAGRA